MLKNLPANVGDARDVVSIPVLGRSPGSSGRNILEYLDILLQYSRLGNPMDRGVWWATVHRVAKRHTQLSAHTKQM